MEAILNFIGERWPFLAILIIVVFLAVIATIKIVKTLSRIKDLEDSRAKTSDLPCDTHTSSINSHNSRFDNIDTKLSSIQETLTIICTHLIEKDSKAAKLFSRKASPRKLNEEGQRIFNEYNGTSFLQNNEDLLLNAIQEKNPSTALDVEKRALEVLYENVNSTIFNEIKVKLYNSPSITLSIDGKEEPYTLTMNDICFIFSIALRDLYLEKHPEVIVE